MPGWANELVFAEEFHLAPGEVERQVSVEWWNRWLLWKKAQASHDLWTAWNKGTADMNPDQAKLHLWAMMPEEY